MAVRVARVGLNNADPEQLAAFYEQALGFVRVGKSEPLSFPSLRAEGEAIQPSSSGVAVPWIASPSARNDGSAVTLRLGETLIDLTASDPPGAAYPDDVPGWSPLFQHFAIVVCDMAAAYARLSSLSGWRTISTGGPQRLPDSSGGVTAFKFRDPEGHPLEFLAFPEGKVPAIWQRPEATDPCLGIDHSAISVAETERSVRFYESLGCTVGARSHNIGPEQARLDGLDDPDLAVTGLNLPGQAAPHIELLCYTLPHEPRTPERAPSPGPERGPAPHSAASGTAVNDIAATRLVLAFDSPDALAAACARHRERLVASSPDAALLRDPDGHLLLLALSAA